MRCSFRAQKHTAALLVAVATIAGTDCSIDARVAKHGEAATRDVAAGTLLLKRPAATLAQSVPDVAREVVFDEADKLHGMLGGPISWYAIFATTSIVIAYSSRSPLADVFADAARHPAKWPAVLTRPDVRLASIDPATNGPQSFRPSIVAKLAQTYYHHPSLAAQLFGERRKGQLIVPDDKALFQSLSDGTADAAFVYAVDAATHHLPTIVLPSEINLGEVQLAEHYASASVRIDGTEHRGAPIEYGCSVLNSAKDPADAARFLRFVLIGDGRRGFENSGLVYIRRSFHGDAQAVPEPLR